MHCALCTVARCYHCSALWRGATTAVHCGLLAVHCGVCTVAGCYHCSALWAVNCALWRVHSGKVPPLLCTVGCAQWQGANSIRQLWRFLPPGGGGVEPGWLGEMSLAWTSACALVSWLVKAQVAAKGSTSHRLEAAPGR